MSADPVFLAMNSLMAASRIAQAAASIREQRFNAALAEAQARLFEDRSKFEGARIDRQKRLLQGKQRALFLKSGVLLEGTPLEVLADTEAEFELEKRLRQHNLSTEASIARSRAKRVRSGVVPTLLGATIDVGRIGFETAVQSRKARKIGRGENA